MKSDEPFNPLIKSSEVPEGLIFRIASRADRIGISDLMAERNPTMDYAKILETTDREISRIESGERYKVYIAELNNQVIGFCRFFHSEDLPANKKIHPGPVGWYGMGIVVTKSYRRRNIAKFLSVHRRSVLKDMGAKEIYSIVDTNNLTSMKMHAEFGYVEAERGPGFLHIVFDGGTGCLFRLAI